MISSDSIEKIKHFKKWVSEQEEDWISSCSFYFETRDNANIVKLYRPAHRFHLYLSKPTTNGVIATMILDAARDCFKSKEFMRIDAIHCTIDQMLLHDSTVEYKEREWLKPIWIQEEEWVPPPQNSTNKSKPIWEL